MNEITEWKATDHETVEYIDCIVGHLTSHLSLGETKHIVWTGVRRLTDERRLDFMRQLWEFCEYPLDLWDSPKISVAQRLRKSKMHMGRYKYLNVTTYLLNGVPKIDLDCLDWSAGGYPREHVRIILPE